MRVVITSLAVLALCACSKPADKSAADANMAMDANMTMDANMAMDANMTMDANMAMPAALDIKGTSWEFTQNGKAMQESIDENGNYITVSGKEHVDHGTAVMKDGKACFTSAVNKGGEMCWTDPKTAVGQSGETTSDKGEKLTVKRVDYVARTM